jgi:hypothetical protein
MCANETELSLLIWNMNAKGEFHTSTFLRVGLVSFVMARWIMGIQIKLAIYTQPCYNQINLLISMLIGISDVIKKDKNNLGITTYRYCEFK